MKLASIPILQVWHALGGGELRHNRGQAFWDDGDGYSVSLNAERGTWCHYGGKNEKGGLLALVETALNCDRAEALGWLEANCGLNPSNRLPLEERRRYARAKADAPALGQRLADLARGLELTATPRGRRLLKTATAEDIVARWQELESVRRNELEALGRQDRLDAEAVTVKIVALLAKTQELEEKRAA